MSASVHEIGTLADRVQALLDDSEDWSFLTDDDLVNLGAFLAIAVREGLILPSNSGSELIVNLVSTLLGERTDDESNSENE